MQFTTLNTIQLFDDGHNRQVRYTGTVQELSYSVQKHISQYIPITRYKNLQGPLEPDPAGGVEKISHTLFAYPFDRKSLEVVGAQLQAPAVSATSEAGI